tara:strand:- start:134 stop:403 length:270 start_codon:yes stop_codon:yes gene_type:complete
MSKYQKYINYVVGDLMKDTSFDVSGEYFSMPFIDNHPSHTFESWLPSYDTMYMRGYRDYVTNKYGVGESELDIVWVTYSRKVLELIKNG